MENWGLITYRETSLLYSPEESSAQAKQWIGTIHILRKHFYVGEGGSKMAIFTYFQYSIYPYIRKW